MGQWLKAMGGFTVPQISLSSVVCLLTFAINLAVDRQLPVRHDRIRDRLYPRLRDLDRRDALACTMARARVHVHLRDHLEHMHSRMEEPEHLHHLISKADVPRRLPNGNRSSVQGF